MVDYVKNVIADLRSEEQSDPVNSPAHYVRGGIECIDAIMATIKDLDAIEGFYTGNATKYLFRWKEKNGVEDLEKAAWYVARLIEYAKAKRKADGTR